MSTDHFLQTSEKLPEILQITVQQLAFKPEAYDFKVKR